MNDTECISTDTIRQRIREEALRLRASQMGRKLDQAAQQQEQIEELSARLQESEADRAARLDQIIELTRLIKESEKKSEADRAANKLQRIPLLGYAVRALTVLMSLPKIVRSRHERPALTETAPADGTDREPADAHLLDALYMSFEDRFRGTKADIRRKLSVYLPLIADMKSGKGALSVLDVGCGRGEWLELLQENGHRVRGIDINRTAVLQCREDGLDVAEADVIEYLRGLGGGTLDVITGFHIIEHLPFEKLVALLDEARIVLKPGGMILFETPNPTNILVSAYDFHRDPSHIRPLHPDTLDFIAQSRGFVRTGSYFVSDDGAKLTLIPSTQWKLDTLDDYIRAPRDYALIGYKP